MDTGRSRRRVFPVLVMTAALAAALPATVSAAPGDRDTSFGGDGRVSRNFVGFFDIARDVLVQPNGKVVVIGQASTGPMFGSADFGVARFRDDGAPDGGFSGDGRQRTDFLGSGETAEAVARQSDGKLVVVGSSSGASEIDARFALARYTTGGALDTTFSGDGLVRTAFPGYSSAGAFEVVVRSDDKIVVVGGGSVGPPHRGTGSVPAGGPGNDSDILLARYRKNGTLDLTFGGGDGRVATDFGGAVDNADAAVLVGGKILVVGMTQAADLEQRFIAIRYNPDGSRDTAFHGDGKVAVNLVDGESERATGVAVRADGKILVGGWATNAVSGTSDADIAIMLLRSNGSRFLPFGGGDGIVFRDFGGTERPDAMERHADGKLVYVATRPFVSAMEPQAIWVFRLQGSGVPDAGFGTGGRSEIEFPGGVGGFGLTLDQEARIVAVGRVGIGDDADFAVTRLLP